MNESNAQPAVRSLEELGAEFASLRESKNLTLDDVASETCIRKNFLEDIEKGDFSRFKALVYARGFVRTYAGLLGAPGLWDEASARLTPEAFAAAKKDTVRKAAPAPRTGSARLSMQPPSSAAAPARGFRRSSMRRNCLILLFALVVAAVAGLFGNWDRIHTEISRLQSRQALDGMLSREAEQAQHDEKVKAEEEAVLREREAQAEAAAAESAAQAEVPEPIPEPEPAPEPAPEPVKPVLTLRARGDCWLQINRGSDVLIRTTVRNGWEAAYDLDSALSMRLGNARNISYSTDGQNFTPLTGGVQRYEALPDGTVQRQAKN